VNVGAFSESALDRDFTTHLLDQTAHVRTVVTEYSVAELFGRSVRERAHALMAIAHPDFRDALEYEARQRFHL
jgi:acyl-CoA hydrolase